MDIQSRLAIAALCKATEVSRDSEVEGLRAEVQELWKRLRQKDKEIRILEGVFDHIRDAYTILENMEISGDEDDEPE